MTKAFLPLAVLASLSLAAPAAATDVAVTRFHTAESLGQAAPGPIAVRAGAGMEAGTLETQIWLDAVAAALTNQGFLVVPEAARVAELIETQPTRTQIARYVESSWTMGVVERVSLRTTHIRGEGQERSHGTITSRRVLK